jgi:hypothetical protein
MVSCDPPQFRTNDGDHLVQRFRIAVVPCRQHPGDIVLWSFAVMPIETLSKKDRRALTVPAPVSGIQSRNNFNRTKKGASAPDDIKAELELEAIEELEDKIAPIAPTDFRLSSNHNETLVVDLED